jgi:hypothetical protein
VTEVKRLLLIALFFVCTGQANLTMPSSQSNPAVENLTPTPASRPLELRRQPSEGAANESGTVRVTIDEALSSETSDYLHHRRLPYVDARISRAESGDVSSVVLTGRVRTAFGKDDAERKVRSFFGNVTLAIHNQIDVGPSLLTAEPPVSQSTIASHEVGRPPALQPQSGCELWRGTFSGNDPSVLVEARLCTDNQGEVTGVVQWSSLRSGYNIREVAGTREPDGRLVLHDVQFRESHSRFWWRFCLIDQYVLEQDTHNHLIGTYQSHACNDRADINLYLFANR